MRGALLAFICGCTIADPTADRGPDESEVASLIDSCPTGTWCVEGLPVTVASATLLHAVWAASPDAVFAVGNNGTILRRLSGNDWAAMDSGTTNNLRTVWGSSSSDVWAGGSFGVLLHFDGDAWSPVDIGGALSNVEGIWGSSATDVWFCGGAAVLHWNGASFSPTGIGGTLRAISGTGPKDVWVTGETVNLRHYTGSTWVQSNPGIGASTFFAVSARTTSDVWAADFMPGKETTRWNGSKWISIRTGGGVFHSLAAVAANDVWGVGGSDIGHWNGAAWTLDEPFGPNVTLWSITVTSGQAWVVGDGGLIAHRAL